MLVASPLGTVAGYGFTSVFLNYNLEWTLAFRIMSGMIIASAFIFLFIPSKYININEVLEAKKKLR